MASSKEVNPPKFRAALSDSFILASIIVYKASIKDGAKKGSSNMQNIGLRHLHFFLAVQDATIPILNKSADAPIEDLR